MRVLDAGLSTGGFTDCLLQRGASHVVGVDVGYGQVSRLSKSFSTAKADNGYMPAQFQVHRCLPFRMGQTVQQM